ncbi:uncharacterized protein EI97DRAFT_436216 [Westerdykella ornata]|uniref:Uncharacterized protein n=1 Tax=Westerdykella ornata TaxID=318751 RepID=A0A6A6JCK0_WESOR|nr:uncharacterized protein EI97DRAFT_436216 [Westerdykella ornata]KAF2273356.1 hypothetical protein EI97DRAFT_436216 [Westerdykella ornata]
MPTNQEAKEVAEHIASRLHQHNTNSGNPQQSSIPHLVLEIAVESLKIHRLHLEERVRQSRAAMPKKSDSRKGMNRAESERRGHGHRERDSQQRRHSSSVQGEPVHRLHTPSPRAGRVEVPNPPSNTPVPASPPGERRKRRRRMSPIGNPPTYQPKMGLTLGFGTLVRNCIEYEARRIGKEQRRKERRGRRDERTRKPSERETQEELEKAHGSVAQATGHEPRRSSDPPTSGSRSRRLGANRFRPNGKSAPPVGPGGKYRPAQLYYGRRDSPHQVESSRQPSAGENPRRGSRRTPNQSILLTVQGPRTATETLASAKIAPRIRNG